MGPDDRTEHPTAQYDRVLVVSALRRFGPRSFRPESFRPWAVSAYFGGSFRSDLSKPMLVT